MKGQEYKYHVTKHGYQHFSSKKNIDEKWGWLIQMEQTTTIDGSLINKCIASVITHLTQ